MSQSNNITQFLKFSFVGVLNTLITLLTIWVCVNIFSTSHYVANVVGYIIGVMNSYFLNKFWTFNNISKFGVTFAKFVGVFGISYLIQFGVLAFLLHYTHFEPFVCQLFSMAVYTIINFILNKTITFKSNKKKIGEANASPTLF